MVLDELQAKEILEHPKYAAQIQGAKFYESQLRVFTQKLSKNELYGETYWSDLLGRLSDRTKKKFNRILDFSRFPLPVIQLSDSIFKEYFKVFEGKNRYFNVQADRDVSALENWINECDPVMWIEENGKDVLSKKPTSFVVVDIDENGKPYLVLIDGNRLIDAKYKDKKGQLEYIAFIHSVKKSESKPDQETIVYAVYDSENYHLYQRDTDQTDFIFIESIPHTIGYCPARSFITSSPNENNPFIRESALAGALSKIEDWTIFDVFRNYMDHYAPFPVTEAVVNECADSNCVNGKVSRQVLVDAKTNEYETFYSDCKTCKGGDKGQGVGPGLHVGIRMRGDKSESSGAGVFKMIFPETDKMKYIPEKLNDLELEIKNKVVGVNDLSNTEAFNKEQVKGSFASRENILVSVKSELDVLYKWIVTTTANIFYTNIDISVDADFGTEFYLVSEDDLQKRFENAKKIGLPQEEQLNIFKQLINTKYKSNADKLERELMLLDIDPYPLYSISECIELKKESVIDDFELSLKVNFQRFLSRFESENVTITKFGLLLPYWSRVEQIIKNLYLYNTNLIEEKVSRSKINNQNSLENGITGE